MAKAILVISYDLPEGVDEGYAKAQRIADNVRDIFKDESDVKVRMAVREAAEAVIDFFEEGG